MNIRPVKENDLSDVHALGVKVFGSIAHSALVIRQFFDLHHPHIFVAEDKEAVIRGYCIGGIEAQSSTGHIVSLAVDPDARRQKLGFLLTEKVIDEFKKASVQEVKLVVSPANQGAINLYLQLGFKQGLVIQNYFGPGADRLTMKRPATL